MSVRIHFSYDIAEVFRLDSMSVRSWRHFLHTLHENAAIIFVYYYKKNGMFSKG